MRRFIEMFSISTKRFYAACVTDVGCEGVREEVGIETFIQAISRSETITRSVRQSSID